jgi:hypothetical protein
MLWKLSHPQQSVAVWKGIRLVPLIYEYGEKVISHNHYRTQELSQAKACDDVLVAVFK